MRDFMILTDSCCDLPADKAAELELSVLPLSFRMEGREYFNYPDNRDIAPHAFYDKLRTGSLGTTAALNVGTYEEAMLSAVQRGLDVLCICFSSALSTTYQSACIAAEDVMQANPGSTVAVVDSLCASLGQGMLLCLAAEKKRSGASLEEVRAYVEERKLHICHLFTVDDLNHLKRGGRVSATAALFGTMLQMKPLLHVDDEGRLIPTGKIRGRKASIHALVEQMEELVEDPSLVFVSHGDCPEEAEGLARAVQERFGTQPVLINHVGPVIGNHSGPGTMALFFQGKNR